MTSAKGAWKLLLASSSPRRADLLRQAGISFDVLKIDCDAFEKELETAGGLSPERYALEAAIGKLKIALSAAGTKHEGAIILCADTIVALGNEIFGKPRDRADAERMLKALSGRSHQVITGCAMATTNGDASISFSSITDVEFYQISDGAIEAYIESGEPMDKAGAYGIQALASVFAKGVRGSYDNVVGLPVGAVARALEESFGISVEAIWKNSESV